MEAFYVCVVELGGCLGQIQLRFFKEFDGILSLVFKNLSVRSLFKLIVLFELPVLLFAGASDRRGNSFAFIIEFFLVGRRL